MKAYLTALNFQYTNKALFRSALLFYSSLYLPIDPSKVNWAFIEEYRIDYFAFEQYFEFKPGLFEKVQDRMHFIEQAGDSLFARLNSQSFFETFIPDMIYNADVFERVVSIVASAMGITESELAAEHPLKMVDCIVMQQDLFISDFVARKHKLDTIMLIGEAKLRDDLLAHEDIPFKEERSSFPVKRFFPYKSLHEMLGKSKTSIMPFPLAIKELLVPDLAKIPLQELIEFVAKDKARPISLYVDDLIEKYGSNLTSDDLAQEIIEQFFKVSKILWPSIGNIAIGLIGNIPLPIPINPVGLWGSHKDILVKAQVDKDFAWIMAVQELRKKT